MALSETMPPTISETGGPSSSNGTINTGRRFRSKTTSTPAGHHGLNSMFHQPQEIFQPRGLVRRMSKTKSSPLSGDMWKDSAAVVVSQGEVVVTVTDPKGEKFMSKMKTETLNYMRNAVGPVTLVQVATAATFEGQYLDGFVRRKGRTKTLSNLSLKQDSAE